MSRYLKLSLAAVLFICPVINAAAATMAFTGTATNTDGATLYQESHKIEGVCQQGVFQPQTDNVMYRKPAEELTFASKTLRYTDSPLRPVVDFKQPTVNEFMTIKYPAPESVLVAWKRANEASETFRVSYSGELVVDAGFDNLVRKHWQDLIKKKQVEFSFLAPTRGESYQFIVEPAQHSEIDADYVFRIRPDSTLLRLLVDPIVLGYNKRGALTDYIGLTNIRKNPDTNYTAHIHYSVTTWPECELTP